jgi:acyl carrier protein
MPETTTTTEISDWLVGRIEFYGRVAPGSFTLDSPLEDLGLDSIYAMALLADIEDTYRVPLEPTAFEELTTLRQLSDGIAARLPVS